MEQIININNNLGYQTGYYTISISYEKRDRVRNILNNNNIYGFGIGDNPKINSNVILYLEFDTKDKIDGIIDLVSEGGIDIKLVKVYEEKYEYVEPFALS